MELVQALRAPFPFKNQFYIEEDRHMALISDILLIQYFYLSQKAEKQISKIVQISENKVVKQFNKI
jgi:hypothetical protein